MTTEAAVSTDRHDPEPAWVAAVKALEGAYADMTLQTCIDQFRRFEQWCAAEARCALPATGDSVAAHVLAIFPAWSTRTVLQRLQMIRRVHELMGEPDPTRTETAKLAFRRGLRAHGRPPRQARPVNAAMRDRLLAACGDDLGGLRDRMMVSVGYDTLCRCSELTALRVEDLTPRLDGTWSALVRRGKTDPAGTGQVAFISRKSVPHLQAWLAASGVRTGTLVRGVNHGTLLAGQLTRQAVRRTLRTLAARAGYDADTIRGLSCHSMRVGAAQDLAIGGRTFLQIMQAGRWHDVRAVSRYVGKAVVNVWADAS